MTPAEYGAWRATQTPPATSEQKQKAAVIIAADYRDKQMRRAS